MAGNPQKETEARKEAGQTLRRSVQLNHSTQALLWL